MSDDASIGIETYSLRNSVSNRNEVQQSFSQKNAGFLVPRPVTQGSIFTGNVVFSVGLTKANRPVMLVENSKIFHVI